MVDVVEVADAVQNGNGALVHSSSSIGLAGLISAVNGLFMFAKLPGL
jgi:hypothetical protein